MLPEQRATRYEALPGSSRIVVETSPSRPGLRGDVPARILLDASRHLVGIDVAPDRPDRVIVMLGPHENVEQMENVRIHVDADGARLRLEGRAAELVAPGKSPYLGT